MGSAASPAGLAVGLCTWSVLHAVGEVSALQMELCLMESGQPPRQLVVAGMFAHLPTHRAMVSTSGASSVDLQVCDEGPIDTFAELGRS